MACSRARPRGRDFRGGAVFDTNVGTNRIHCPVHAVAGSNSVRKFTRGALEAPACLGAHRRGLRTKWPSRWPSRRTHRAGTRAPLLNAARSRVSPARGTSTLPLLSFPCNSKLHRPPEQPAHAPGPRPPVLPCAHSTHGHRERWPSSAVGCGCSGRLVAALTNAVKYHRCTTAHAGLNTDDATAGSTSSGSGASLGGLAGRRGNHRLDLIYRWRITDHDRFCGLHLDIPLADWLLCVWWVGLVRWVGFG